MWLGLKLFIVSVYTRKLLLYFTDMILNVWNLTFFSEYVLNKWMDQWINEWYSPHRVSYFVKMYIQFDVAKLMAKKKNLKTLNTKYSVMFFGVISFFFFLKQWSYLGLMVLQLMYTFKSEINF